MKISLRAKLLHRVLLMLGIKRFAQAPEEEFIRRLRATNKKRGYFFPTDKKAHYEDLVVEGGHHCLKIMCSATPSERAILFFFGGGMLMDGDKNDVKTGRKLMEATGCDVWFPFYPLCLDHDVEYSIRTAFNCYREMIAVYGGGNVSTCGCSSGGMMSIAIGLYNNTLDEKLPMPRHIVPISPGEIPVDEAERERMLALNDRDAMVDLAFMDRVGGFLTQGRTDLPEWMLQPSKGDFSNFPKVHFFYSEDEILYGALPNYEAALKRYGVEYEVDSRPGMVHCYPVMTFIPEGKAAFDRLTRILSS